MAKSEEALNDYRSERKARIAKAAKKSKKGGVDSTKVAQIVIYAIAGIAVLAFIGWGIWYFGVPQRYMTAVSVDGRNYSYSEYSYYYASVYQSLANSASEQKETYGFSLYDTSKSPDAQTTTDEDGNSITYAQYIDNSVITTMEQTVYYLKLANAEGMELNAEHQTEVNSTLESIKTYADQYGYSVSRYISLLYGKGLTEKVFKKLLTEQYLVSQYLEENTDKLSTDLTDDEVNEYYAKDPTAYESIDLRIFGFEIPEAESTDEETEATATDTTELESLAEDFKGKITDEASFITLAQEYCDEEDAETFASDTATLAKSIKKSTVSSNISSDLADWLFDDARQAGDTTITKTDSYIYVVYVIAPAERNEDTLVDARHILVSFDNVKSSLEAAAKEETEETTEATTTEETTAEAAEETTTAIEVKTETADDGSAISNADTNYSIEVVLEAYNQAHDILEEYAKTGTEEAFAALANEKSADTGSNENGGLYTNIEKGAMVEPFENWIYDENRVAGDTGIIQTTYGYHVMYFVKTHTEPAWKEEVRSALAAEKETEFEDNAKVQYSDTATHGSFYDYASKEALALVNKNFVSSNS